MLERLDAALNATGYPFAFGAWSERPKGDYGAYMLDQPGQLRADNDSAAEVMRAGFVDLFTHDRSAAPIIAIETALRGLGLWFQQQTPQIEPSNGLIHYEWRWSDPGGVTVLLVTFENSDGTVLQRSEQTFNEIPEYEGGTPEYPGADPAAYTFAGWTPALVPVTKSARYVATYEER